MFDQFKKKHLLGNNHTGANRVGYPGVSMSGASGEAGALRRA
jgi:hypothetical protein